MLQVPGWLLLALALVLLFQWDWITAQAAVWIIALWLLKDVLLYPVYRPALNARDAAAPGAAGLKGRRGWSRTAINGRGLVEVAGERWLARSADGEPIDPGTQVEVVGHQDMVLHVRPRHSTVGRPSP